MPKQMLLYLPTIIGWGRSEQKRAIFTSYILTLLHRINIFFLTKNQNESWIWAKLLCPRIYRTVTVAWRSPQQNSALDWLQRGINKAFSSSVRDRIPCQRQDAMRRGACSIRPFAGPLQLHNNRRRIAPPKMHTVLTSAPAGFITTAEMQKWIPLKRRLVTWWDSVDVNIPAPLNSEWLAS